MIPTIEAECSEFLSQSNCLPMIKMLPIHSDGFRKVKVRHKKINDPIDKLFNDQFNTHEDVLTRSIFVNGSNIESVDLTLEPFYVFPINGFKYMYNPQAIDYSEDYKLGFETLINVLPANDAQDTLKYILGVDYSHSNLLKALECNCEIIIYGIPFYYAIRKSLIVDYPSFCVDK